MASYPYSPSTVLSAPSSGGGVYVFRPGSGSKSVEVLALNATATLHNRDLPYSTISPSVPFLKDDQSTYIPVIDQQGNIYAYAGACAEGSQGSSLWTLENPQKSLDGNGTWQELGLATNAVDKGQILDGANHLAAGIAFASNVNSTPGVYIFGGMCPDSANLTADSWTQSANYSNNMLGLQPNKSPASSPLNPYQLSVTPSRGPPVAEAGFTITALNLTFSRSTDGQSQLQNQNFVLIGGHTQMAFINMSQIALFSLPEQSWSFLPVDLPGVPSTDLARRHVTAIDSRSGHTALLTSDGKRIIVFGGWVGDVTHYADPQLAILEVGSGYGGTGDWKWSIPDLQGPGPTAGTGLYGHGAVMLPGDVMMVVGGYGIPSSTNSRRKRQAPAANSNTYFLNTTSNSWALSYDHPALSRHSSSRKPAESTTVARKAGLGAGLTLGVLAIMIAVIVYFWYSKRLKKKREKREDLRRLAAGVPSHLAGQDDNLLRRSTNEMTTVEHPEGVAFNRNSHHGFYAEPRAERTGLHFEIPSPTRGLRRSLHSRGIYQPAPRYDNGRRTPDFVSTIHPIDEREEYEEVSHSGPSAEQETLQRKDLDLLSNVPVLNPFQDSADLSRSPSPQSLQGREIEIRRWVNDWTPADALMPQQGGRLSPEKTDRTSSTLSDQSARSLLSSGSWQPSAGTMGRTMSQRSAALFNVVPFRSTIDTTPMELYPQSLHRGSLEHRRTNSAKLHPGAERMVETPTSFMTAKTSWHQQHGEISTDEESSPTKQQGRARGFMGSLRRAFASERSASTSPEHPYSITSSPTKPGYYDSYTLQRRASTGETFWQAKQGAKDWDVEGRSGNSDSRKSIDGDEWDVESAVQNREVQVMFTVPKDKLRVVNRSDEDGASILSSKKESKTADGGAEPSDSKGKQVEE